MVVSAFGFHSNPSADLVEIFALTPCNAGENLGFQTGSFKARASLTGPVYVLLLIVVYICDVTLLAGKQFNHINLVGGYYENDNFSTPLAWLGV